MKKIQIIFKLLLICFPIILLGCYGTITPKIAKSNVISFDGNDQNAGFIGFTKDKDGIITFHKRDEYNSLIGVYGNKFLVPLNKDDGLVKTTTNTYIIDKEHLYDFIKMEKWWK